MIADQAIEVAERHKRPDDLLLEADNFGAQIAARDLAKIVDELVDNAFKFSEPGTPVVVRAYRENDCFGFSIRDAGRGMSEEQIDSIGAYMQFNRALYEQQGLGFGLVIAKRLAELHRGQVIITSAPDEGTEVTVRCRLHE